MKKLEITKEAALKAHEEASPKGKLLLENLLGQKVFIKDIKERIQNFSDILSYHGKTPSEFLTECKDLSDDEIAYKQIKLIVSAYNQNEVPDYDNSNQVKYEPRFKLSSSGVGFSCLDCVTWGTCSLVGSRLVFLNYDNMIDAVNKFLPIYEKFQTNNSNN